MKRFIQLVAMVIVSVGMHAEWGQVEHTWGGERGAYMQQAGMQQAGMQQEAPMSHAAMQTSEGLMRTGSRYSIGVSEVGANSPMAVYDLPIGDVMSASSRPRRAPEEDEDGYDPKNAQYGSLPDGTLYMLLLAMLAVVAVSVRSVRKRKKGDE